MPVTFVTNFCPHYRARTFAGLHRRLGAEFLFYSRGGEDYWPSRFGVRSEAFPHRYLSGLEVAGTRITPGLVPRVLTGGRDPVVKCINGRFALPATYLMARARRRPFILWTGIWHRLRTPFHRFIQPVTRWIYRHADAVVVYGSHVERFLVSEGVPSERIFVAPHAVDNEAFRRAVPPDAVRAVRTRSGIPEDQLLVLFVGRLVPEKGVSILLDAFASLPIADVHLLFVGQGPERERLEAEAVRLGVEARVHFDGSVRPDSVVSCYAAADLLVLPSVTTSWFREPWGLVVNEAFNQALPAVVSDAVGAAAGGLVTDRETGRVVPEGNRAALTDAMANLLADGEARAALGRAARERVLAWNDEAMVDGFAQAVEHVRRPR